MLKKQKQLIIFAIIAGVVIVIALILVLQTGTNVPTNTETYNFTNIQIGTEAHGANYFFPFVDDFKASVCGADSSVEKKNLRCEVIEISTDVNYLVHEYSEFDDSIASNRVVYRIQLTDKGWAISGKEVKHKCHSGRGNTDWNSEVCV